MDKNLIALIIAELVMHYNQDMNAAFWIAAAVIVFASLRVADKLDGYGRTKRDNRANKQ